MTENQIKYILEKGDPDWAIDRIKSALKQAYYQGKSDAIAEILEEKW